MTEYFSFWLAKIIVEMAVAAFLIVILLAAFFIGALVKRKAQEK